VCGQLGGSLPASATIAKQTISATGKYKINNGLGQFVTVTVPVEIEISSAELSLKIELTKCKD
jgi:hypothetical protein